MQTKYDIVLDHEESFAQAVATGVVMRKPLTVWHLLIPFMFVFHFQRLKKETEVFARNFLFTRKLAFDGAYEIYKGEDRQNRLAKIENETRDRFIAQKLYSWKIHQGQMVQISLLIDHYLKLLEAEGSDYLSVVKGVYKTRANYTDFLNQLKQAEKEVNRVALQAVGGTETAYQLISGMEKAAERMRTAEAEKIFA